MDTHEWHRDEDLEDYEFADYDYKATNDFFENTFGGGLSLQPDDNWNTRFEDTNFQMPAQRTYPFNTNTVYIKEEPDDVDDAMNVMDTMEPFSVSPNTSQFFRQQFADPQFLYQQQMPQFQNPYHQMQTIKPSIVQPPQPVVKFAPQTPPEPPKHSQNQVDVLIENQPPVEVRTRTPSETRTFSVSVRAVGPYRQLGATLMSVSLWYAANDSAPAEPVKKDILGGTKTTQILPDGLAIFDNLSISESSTKHKEREFFLNFVLLRNDGHELLYKKSRNFYAFSHKKVLQRRGSVKLRTLNKNWGRITGGDAMHVIGSPFIQGPALALVIRTPHGDVNIKSIEYFSDSVLFFDLPPYPIPDGMMVTPTTELKVQILVTNDGRTFSNALDFTYIADPNSMRSRI
mmetsp:Transcript_29527/g.41546  ORF Transcript_29527/g.41546 Transcript_29527/m.41546 type:complete len:401 (-) Transcript_29527:154-1356(-)|eukprot:CAMPEP_0168555202 /NCGR_PEP_ID=MMETSP0413-20121227/8198_1 /TAXON_ID=136452 /ORGANISM="Filamoeba nolandi, Strain NC-AS-23-1" /LENGTH=400 /DNA_ID=CAMNT_0008586015 /DNA_START=66 /DNA_END=1268 /DNA_ORIENTATION=+